MNKLPKQWKHWLKKYNFKSPYIKNKYLRRYSRSDRCFVFKKGDHLYRVTSSWIIQKSCHISDFDRWANSTLLDLGPVPTIEAEFREMMKGITKV